MTDDILAGIHTAIDHGAKCLGPAIDRMIEWADTLYGSKRGTVLRQAELLRWMMYNVERVDSAGVLRMWCEFPCNATMHMITPLGPLRICDIYKSIRELYPNTEFGWRSGGFIVPITLAAWVGETCWVCEGSGIIDTEDLWRSWPCKSCNGSGRISAVGPRAVLTGPIRELVFETIATYSTPHSKQWIIVESTLLRMPDMIRHAAVIDGIRVRYPTREAARAAVSTAALNWARRQAGMQHDAEGRRFER